MAGGHHNLLSFIYSLTHPLSHLALLAILALTLNQIYHGVWTVSVFILHSAASLLFLFEAVSHVWLTFVSFTWS